MTISVLLLCPSVCQAIEDSPWILKPDCRTGDFWLKTNTLKLKLLRVKMLDYVFFITFSSLKKSILFMFNFLSLLFLGIII